MNQWFDRVARRVAESVGRPWVFACALLVVLVWAAAGPLFHWSDTHQLIINTSTTIVTFLMIFLVQNTQNRDNLALNAKLDDLIARLTEDYHLEQIEEKSEGEIREARDFTAEDTP